jgi:hypothetical protein
MDDQAPTQNTNPATPADTTQCRMFITIEMSGERKYVTNFVPLLEEQIQHVVNFMNGMIHMAAPRTKNMPAIVIHPTQGE